MIDRRDGIINLFEMKYANTEFTITNTLADDLLRKQEAFRNEKGTYKALHITFVTTYGLSRKEYWSSVQSEVTMNDFFAPARK